MPCMRHALVGRTAVGSLLAASNRKEFGAWKLQYTGHVWKALWWKIWDFGDALHNLHIYRSFHFTFFKFFCYLFCLNELIQNWYLKQISSAWSILLLKLSISSLKNYEKFLQWLFSSIRAQFSFFLLKRLFYLAFSFYISSLNSLDWTPRRLSVRDGLFLSDSEFYTNTTIWDLLKSHGWELLAICR